jgi:hypothetical protein
MRFSIFISIHFSHILFSSRAGMLNVYRDSSAARACLTVAPVAYASPVTGSQLQNERLLREIKCKISPSNPFCPITLLKHTEGPIVGLMTRRRGEDEVLIPLPQRLFFSRFFFSGISARCRVACTRTPAAPWCSSSVYTLARLWQCCLRRAWLTPGDRRA